MIDYIKTVTKVVCQVFHISMHILSNTFLTLFIKLSKKGPTDCPNIFNGLNGSESKCFLMSKF